MYVEANSNIQSEIMKNKQICFLVLGLLCYTTGLAQHFIIQSQNFNGNHIDDPIRMVRMSFEQGLHFRIIQFQPGGNITSSEFTTLIPKGRALIPLRFHQNEYGMVEQGVVDVYDHQIEKNLKGSPLFAVISYATIDKSGKLGVFCQFKITLEAESGEVFAQNPRLTNVEMTQGDKFLTLTADDVFGDKTERPEVDESLPPMPPPVPHIWKSQHHNVSVVYKTYWQLGNTIDSTDLVQAEWTDMRTGEMYILEKYRPSFSMTQVPDAVWYPVFVNQFLKNLKNTKFAGRKSVIFRDKSFEQLTFKEDANVLGATVGLAYIRRTEDWVYKVYFIYHADEEEIPKRLLEINDNMKWE